MSNVVTLPVETSVKKKHPPGLVGVIAQDTARFSVFAASLSSLEVPEGTAIKWVIGHGIAAQANMLVEALFDEAPAAEWLWIMGDDHAFSPQILNRLLDHDVDIVTPLCLTRQPPYKPVMCTGFTGEGMMRARLNPNDYPDGGLVPIHSSGSAGMLVRREVFEIMSGPWFETGGISGVEIGEDFYFCDKARDLGFELWGDLDTNLGHVTTATVWPVRQEDGWTYGFGFNGGLKVTMPVGAWEDANG
jgi:hypothetical protein